MKVKAFTVTVLTLFLMVTLFAAVPMKADPAVGDPVKIAVVGPQGWIQWDGIWVGAKMAQEKINLGPDGVEGNADDGIVVNGVNHLIELKAVDSHAVPEPDPSAGSAELLAALEWGADFVVGGFRTECVAPMRETFVEYAKNKETTTGYAPLWFIAGASTDELIDCGGYLCGACVRDDYESYKYVFRVTPMSSTWLAKQIAMFLRYYILPKMAKIYGGNLIDVLPTGDPKYEFPIKTYIVCEDITGTEVFGAVLAGRDWPGCQTINKLGNILPNPYQTPPSDEPPTKCLLGPNCEMVGYSRTHTLTPNFEPVFEDIDATGAHLIIHFFAAVTGVDFIKTWKDRETNAVVVGINVESQMQEFWDKVEGKCEYECFLSSCGTRSNISPDAEPRSTEELWDEYKEKSGDIMSDFVGTPQGSTYPIYTFWGAYDALLSLDESIEEYGSWPIPASKLIPLIEQTDRLGVLGKFKYTGPNPTIDFDLSTAGLQPYPYLDENPTMKGTLHDVYVDDDALTSEWPSGYTRAQITQWQDGLLEVVRPLDQAYSSKWRIPPWMYSLADVDLNWDGKVDMTDVDEAALAFGSYYGRSNWNVEADVSADGKVDIDDVVAITTKYGESAPTWPLE
jgi:branched-chain amino acid transport system substrate-binding protein